MQEAATAFHEMFVTLQTAGFTHDESLNLVAVLIQRTGTTKETND